MNTANNNFFELFNINESFEVDTIVLGERYRELQNKTHPDKFSAAEESEKMHALQLNSLINEAYATLTSPLRRAGYLLQLRGIDTEIASQVDLNMDLLMEQMQQREKLAELPNDDSAMEELETMKKDATNRVQESANQFASFLEANDIQRAKEVFFEMQFLHKLLSEIEQGEEKRLGY